MKLFTLNPAKAIGFDSDRGSLEVGKRADLLAVHHDGIVPRVMEVIRQGKRIA
ncbi:MAG: amidohydrolase family protein [Cyanobacteria bacterium P01_B01_bin.77]